MENVKIISDNSLEMNVNGLFYIGNAIFGAIVYTLLFQSLKKTELVKKIYRFTIVIAIMVFVIGTIILFVNIF